MIMARTMAIMKSAPRAVRIFDAMERPSAGLPSPRDHTVPSMITMNEKKRRMTIAATIKANFVLKCNNCASRFRIFKLSLGSMTQGMGNRRIVVGFVGTASASGA